MFFMTGFPGEMQVKVTFTLTEDNEVIINFEAKAVNKATPVNMTVHPYFNLAGQVINGLLCPFLYDLFK